MLKKVAASLLLLATLGYVTSIAIGHAYVYISSFVMLAAAILFLLLVLAIDLIWKLLPMDFKKSSGGDKARFTVIIFFSILLFYIVKGIIDEFLPYAFGFISLLVNITTFVFVVFLAWCLIRRDKAKNILVGSTIFILFIGLISFFGSTTTKSGEDIQSNPSVGLKTLPYVSWVPVEENTEKENGVVLYDPELAFDGLNLYGSQTSQEAYLIDMNGNVIHKWAKKVQGCGPWKWHVELRDNGDLLVLSPSHMVVWLDWNSNVKGKKKMLVHHDACFDENGNINLLMKKREVIFWNGIPVPIVNDYITVLSPDLEIIKQISICDLVSELYSSQRIAQIYRAMLSIFEPKNVLRVLRLSLFWYKAAIGNHADILHTNTLEIMDRDIEGFCKKGDWLISIRHLNLIGIVDSVKEELSWSWGPGELSWQHHPTLLGNGNVLIFDNGNIRGFSRVVELNPLTKKIVWEYKSKPPEKFFSPTRGCNQRLPNGNTLITESDKAHVFEITKEGKIVWEFYNPHILIEAEDKKRQTIYRMMRITNPERYGLNI